MTIEVRAIKESDVAGFREALDSVAKEKRYLAQFSAPSIERAIDFVTAGIAENVSQFVALDGVRIVGWADIFPDKSATMKHSGSLGMGVVAEYRGQGIGTILLVSCIKKAQGNGISRIALHVRTDNENAIGLYKKVGFQTEGVMKNYMFIDGTYYDALIMSLLTRLE